MIFLFFLEFAQLDWAADSQSLLHDIANKSLSISRLSLPQKSQHIVLISRMVS